LVRVIRARAVQGPRLDPNILSDPPRGRRPHRQRRRRRRGVPVPGLLVINTPGSTARCPSDERVSIPRQWVTHRLVLPRWVVERRRRRRRRAVTAGPGRRRRLGQLRLTLLLLRS
jgi:hypothetical protein